ncbi:MAG TPA: hypothetical protein VLH86_01185 [Patescibacteria group bacterium]|nr:hypothetical protein [Patescibacteria group bacterium]
MTEIAPPIAPVPNRYPDMYVPEFHRVPTDTTDEYITTFWLPTEAEPGVMISQRAENSYHHGYCGHYWFEIGFLHEVSEAGLSGALAEAGVTITESSAPAGGGFGTREMRYPLAPEYCAGANRHFAAHTPPGCEPFRFVVHEQSKFTAELMTRALAAGTMLFSIDNRAAPIYTNYGYHDVQGHSVWMALPYEILDALKTHAQTICAIPEYHARIDAMKDFARILDSGVVSAAFARIVRGGRPDEDLRNLFDELGIRNPADLIRGHLQTLRAVPSQSTHETGIAAAPADSIEQIGAQLVAGAAALQETVATLTTAGENLRSGAEQAAATIGTETNSDAANRLLASLQIAADRTGAAARAAGQAAGNFTNYARDGLLYTGE